MDLLLVLKMHINSFHRARFSSSQAHRRTSLSLAERNRLAIYRETSSPVRFSFGSFRLSFPLGLRLLGRDRLSVVPLFPSLFPSSCETCSLFHLSYLVSLDVPP